jgi:hypothetical protein
LVCQLFFHKMLCRCVMVENSDIERWGQGAGYCRVDEQAFIGITLAKVNMADDMVTGTLKIEGDAKLIMTLLPKINT